MRQEPTVPPFDFAFAAQSPWLLRLTSSIPDATNWLRSVQRQSPAFVTRHVRGRKMRTVEGLYAEFAAAMQFPYYFGENGAAFDECMTDLEWLPAAGYLVLVLEAECLLVDERPEQLRLFLEAFRFICGEWATPIAVGEYWDRPAKAFHFVFQCSEDALPSLALEIGELTAATL